MSCAIQIVAGPALTGLVMTSKARRRALISCSGRCTRSKYLETAWKPSLVVIAVLDSCSSCCKTGSGCLVANVSAGKNNTGKLFANAVPAAVIRLADPGPADVEHA